MSGRVYDGFASFPEGRLHEHDPLCEDSEGLPRYRQCVCFPVKMAKEAERERILKRMRIDEPTMHWHDAIRFVKIVEN